MKRGRDLLLKTISRTRSFLTLRHTAPQMDLSERYSYNPTLNWNPQVEEYFIKAYGADHFSRISNALTRPSCYSCIRVNTLKSTSDDVIEKLLKFVADTGFGGNNTNGTESKKSDCFDNVHINKKQNGYQNADDEHNKDECLVKRSLESGTVSKCQVPGLEYVVFIRGSGPHPVEYDHTCDGPVKEVIVSRKCAEAVLRGAQIYAPGVLACSANVEIGDLVAVSVAVEQPGPDGGWSVGITRGIILQGLQTDPHFLERNGMFIGQGTTTLSRAGMFRVPEGIAVDMSSRVFKLPSFHGVLEGEIFLQNLPSIITAHALDPQCGERVLDMCAAPGGKTTAIAILMKNDGEVFAVDRSHNKVLNIQKLAAEMGLNCITTYKLDALKAVSRRNDSDDMTTIPCSKVTEDVSIQNSDSLSLDLENMLSVTTEVLHAEKTCKEDVHNDKANMKVYGSKADIRKRIRRLKNGPGRNQRVGGRVDNSKGFSPNSFDRVLLDAPCSALGLRPRLFAGEETINSLRNHAKYQRKMFDQAVQLVCPGGVIVYSTCTINPGENEALVRYALDTYKFLSLASQYPRIGGPGIVGCCIFPDGYTEEWLRPGEEELVQRFDPSSALDTIGFFIAKFYVGPKDA